MAVALIRNVWAMACVVLISAPAWSDGSSDPTQPPQASPAAALIAGTAPVAPAYTVQSILFSPRRRLALVNGQEVHEGSQLGGARVVAIASGAVTLDVAGHRQTLLIHADVNHDFALNPAAPSMQGPKVIPQ